MKTNLYYCFDEITLMKPNVEQRKFVASETHTQKKN